MEKQPLLEVNDLKTYFFGKTETVKAVDGVSFEVYPGETFGLVGESGSGKSQTCRSILRLLKEPGKIVSGEILFEGEDIVTMSKKRLHDLRGSEISIIFQEPMTALNPVLTIKKQAFEALNPKFNRSEKLNRTIELMKLVGIPEAESRMSEYTHQFSGGMRQRAMIAIALGSSPKLLLADEPTTALDVTIQDQIMKLLNELKEQLQMSIVLVTHDLGVVAQMCDRVAVMYAGIIVEKADTKSLFEKPRHPYTHALMQSLPYASKGGRRLEPIVGTPPSLSDPPPGCPFHPRCRYAEVVCAEERPILFEIEKGHFTRCHFPELVSQFEGIIKPARNTL